MTIARTETYPNGSEGAYFGGVDLVSALAIVGGTTSDLSLHASQSTFTLGRAPTCDLRIELPYVAALQARLDRVANSNWLRVTDTSSGKNPIIFKNLRSAEFYIRPGDTFTIGKCTFYALNEEMRYVRPAVSEILGPHRYSDIDLLLIAAAVDADRHVVILSEPGNDQERLGLQIHMASLRRRHPYKVVPQYNKPQLIDHQHIREARDGTLLIWIPRKIKFDQRFAAAVVADARTRLVICAQTIGKAVASFPPSIVNSAMQVTIPRLRTRKDEIPQLLDSWFVHDRSALRFLALTPENRHALMTYRWKDNLQELRDAASHLMQLAWYQSERQATKDTEPARNRSREWRKRLGISIPIASQ